MFWNKQRDKNRTLYASPSQKLGAGWWAGGLLPVWSLVMGFALAGVSAGEAAAVVGGLVLGGLWTVFFLGCSVRLSFWLRGAVPRFYEYRGVLGGGTICSVGELAEKINRKPAFVISDLKKMINRKWFLEGKLDEQTNYLVTDLDTWDRYMKIRGDVVRLLERQAEEAAKTHDARASDFLARSDGFLAQLQDFRIKNMNASIVPGVKRLVDVIFRVRRQAMDHPEKALNLKSLLERYLPTVIQLLESYKTMKEQSAANSEVRDTVQTITQTVDTVNAALEKLLENEMKNRVMDASADISVLKTMMHQDGLTEDELAKMCREAKQ